MSFNTALNGLHAAHKRLEIAANNIANVGTFGFKSSRGEFAALFNSSMDGGVRNAVGHGVRLANVSQNFSEGSVHSNSGGLLDMRIQGKGFFVVSDNTGLSYSRAGAFRKDASDYVVDSYGGRLQGYSIGGDGRVISGVRTDLKIDTSNMAPKVTSRMTETLNLDAASPSLSTLPVFNPNDPSTYTKVITRTIKDGGAPEVKEIHGQVYNEKRALLVRGRPAIPPADHELKQYFVKAGDNQWTMYTLIDGRNPSDHATNTPLKATVTMGADGSYSLAGDGKDIVSLPKNELLLTGWKPAEQVNGVWGAAAASGTGTIKMPLNDGVTNALAESDPVLKPRPEFDPNNPASYTKNITTKVLDSAGKEHAVQQYFVKTDGRSWVAFTLIDGRNPVDPASTKPLVVNISRNTLGSVVVGGDEHMTSSSEKEFVVKGWKPAEKVDGNWVASPAVNNGWLSLSLSEGGVNGVDKADAVMGRVVPAFVPTDTNSYNKRFETPIYDSQGNKHVMNQYFIKDDTNSWQMHVLVNGRNPTDPNSTAPLTAQIKFNTDGSLQTMTAGDGLQVVNNTVTLKNWVPARVLDAGRATERWLSNGARSNEAGVVVDMAKMTQYNAATTRVSPQQDGHGAGELSRIGIDKNGILRANFTNGQTKNIGQVMLASFSNEQGLKPDSNNRWKETSTSGLANMDTPTTGILGGIEGGSLEGSNVTLTDELVDLIVAQTSYQANSKVLSTEATLMQTLIQSI
jgi:flagellar hook protein FlgE